jgi:hypothetical protein
MIETLCHCVTYQNVPRRVTLSLFVSLPLDGIFSSANPLVISS